MSSAIVVAILVAAGESHAPVTTAITTAASETLGPNASVQVQEVASPFDANASALEIRLGAAAVVELVWSSGDRTHANVRVHIARLDKWIRHEIIFRPVDNPNERGRTLGFAIGSILATDGEWRPPPNPPPPPAAAAPSASGRPAARTANRSSTPPATAEARKREESEPPSPAPPVVKAKPAPEPEPPPRPLVPPQPAAVEVRAIGSTGLGGPATGLGLLAAGEYFVGGTFWLAASVAARSGNVPSQNGSDMVLSGLAGLAWRPLVPTTERPFQLGLGVQAGGVVHALSHNETAAVMTDRLYVTHPAATATFDVGWRVGADWDLVLAATLEWAFGTIEVDVDNVPVATIPSFRGLVGAGARLHF